MLFYVTNFFLDLVLGTGYWIIKKTSSGVYYLLLGENNIQNMEEYDTIILTKENIENDDRIKEIFQKTIQQEQKIDELSKIIEELKNIINQKIQ